MSVAAANAIEGRQWLVMLMGYGDNRPGRTIEEFRAACAELPAIFSEATGGAVTREVVTFHQAESRRRHFTEAGRLPSRLVSVGDAVASFNPIYGQGTSSAALHASCPASCFDSGADPDAAATEFFRLRQVVVDAAWSVSAGGDAARLDAGNGTEVSEEVRQQRWAMEQIAGATLVDGDVARAFDNVAHMLRHPGTLAGPTLRQKAVAANERSAAGPVTDTAIDRCIGLSDRAVHDDSALEELLALFAPDAIVRLGPEAVRGREAIAVLPRPLRHLRRLPALPEHNGARRRDIAGRVGSCVPHGGRPTHDSGRGGVRAARRQRPRRRPAQRVHPPSRLTRRFRW
ncbi:hypothetical protein [Streptomyces axinellae]|uniref:Uncharacterized protein n=1 Tax=Streptomyces axinellae TaxID=552788 RepID=A0ABN3Q315_9ACTN